MGWLQFEQLSTELLADAGVAHDRWTGATDDIRTAEVDKLTSTALGVELRGPALIAVAWIQSRARRENVVTWARDEAGRQPVLLLTNREALGLLADDANVRVVGPAAISAALDALSDVRRQVPFVLGVRDLSGLVDPDVLARSSADVEAAAALARVFVPTHAYRRTLDVLDRHGFAVVTGPPEMGKTAIARMIGLAALSSGWELHEVTEPDELWRALARDRKQIFIADDAFGSTEYRPDAAERWALELDRVLRAMDANHHLIWTSRPAPLRAGLRRIHREHGVERWPQPAEVQVDARALEVEEKTLILFRHAQAAQISGRAVTIVRTHGETIVAHEHFTPERIRRFVAQRLHALAAANTLTDEVMRREVSREIREPTAAMAASLNALAPELRAVLVALVDCAASPVPERELTRAIRRHAPAGLPSAARELVDRLTDHFVRIVPPDSVTWVHPSWRDLVIAQLADQPEERSRFLAVCGFEGLLLAFSTSGGVAGERELPLLVDDADWDRAAERVHAVVPTLDDHSVFRLVATLTEAIESAAGRRHRKLKATVLTTLDEVQRAWDASRLPVPATVLGAWLELDAAAKAGVFLPNLAATWIETMPTESIDIRVRDELRRLDEWIALVQLLQRYEPEALEGFGFPASQEEAVKSVVLTARALALEAGDDERRDRVASTLRELARIYPQFGHAIRGAVDALEQRDHDAVDWWEPEVPPPRPRRRPRRSRSIVTRILKDLVPGSSRRD